MVSNLLDRARAADTVNEWVTSNKHMLEALSAQLLFSKLPTKLFPTSYPPND